MTDPTTPPQPEQKRGEKTLDFDDLETYMRLVRVANEFECDPSIPIESEVYFRGLLRGFKLEEISLEEWLRVQLSKDFRVLGERPNWIQASEWQFSDGKPMIFAGQLDIPAKTGHFHDDTSLYVFLSVDGKSEPKVVTQQY